MIKTFSQMDDAHQFFFYILPTPKKHITKVHLLKYNVLKKNSMIWDLKYNNGQFQHAIPMHSCIFTWKMFLGVCFTSEKNVNIHTESKWKDDDRMWSFLIGWWLESCWFWGTPLKMSFAYIRKSSCIIINLLCSF